MVEPQPLRLPVEACGLVRWWLPRQPQGLWPYRLDSDAHALSNYSAEHKSHFCARYGSMGGIADPQTVFNDAGLGVAGIGGDVHSQAGQKPAIRLNHIYGYAGGIDLEEKIWYVFALPVTGDS